MNTKILLLDNQDSFVWNLALALQMLGCKTDVVRSNTLDVAAIRRRRPTALVLSPGPGRPESAGVCVAAVRALTGLMPILGVCLGHQAIALAFGAEVVRGEPCHGKAWAIEHRGAGLFRDLPSPLLGCRYHSLVVRQDRLPGELLVDAWTPQATVMALRHRTHPVYGLQFHPESFLTEHGLEILGRFVEGCS